MAYPQETFVRTSLDPGSLIAQRREVVASKTLVYQLEVLKKTGRYDAFKLQWHPSYGDTPNVWPIPNHLFWDSDIGKWIEGACYLLHDQSNPEVQAAVEELTRMINSAQQPDGYLNIHYTVVEPGKRFTNLRDFHELYNAGHLIEGALAHHHLYQNDDLLKPILKYVDLLCRKFGPNEGQIHGYPGHPEIELALLRLYNRTKNAKHLELARYFISERGNPAGDGGEHYYHAEAKRRGEERHVRMAYWGEADALWYYQAHKPIIEQQTIEGHSVRAMYLLTAAADLVGLGKAPDERLKAAIDRLWNNMVECKMYVTGGIGAMKQWEGFGLNYFLPQGTDEGGCYAETCAAIGVMMLAERILQYDLDRRFGDVMELCLYNAMLTAMSYDGIKFTYVNQLASSDKDPSKREEWFTCACCPPNVLRLLGQIGGYIYSHNLERSGEEQINVHLYIPSEYKFKSSADNTPAILTQKSNWPWSGKVEFELQAGELAQIRLALRIPGWARSWKITPSPPATALEKGYLILPASWVSANRNFMLEVEMMPRLVAPHPYTNQDTLALARGPVIYCVEDMDNQWVKDHFKSVQLDPACAVHEELVTDKTTGDTYVALTVAKGASLLRTENIHARPGVEVSALDNVARSEDGVIDELKFVPYFFRANRGGRGQARVGLRRWNR
ncbi:uncharacterized protein Z520_07984 [Fonsecaea multimorphosa CBS 102226]|uniref:DUF1680 domain protein n=1 Tax=Fonsecaea multimorphosa CBS 102226 TaxID=1442371 RepID=A0A0D2IGL9_9EURO|nr:uncharacterized protein Z520_07984 [Fonsecaea multimorphosa CBS 102226]KIX96206.1 hypothetical protein Z520_07984 [Fonsecaea multimorphosa CBS 102226]OAL22217.1 hypothetical protein AYO22_07261 [Fonsecaea multimorphosa]